jgi:ribosome-binding factor A
MRMHVRITTVLSMKPHDHRMMQEIQSLCTEIRPEDGIPPYLIERRPPSKRHAPLTARAWQYCKAAHRALEAGLASVCGDARLQSLTILSVEPQSRGSTLLVIVAAPDADPHAMAALEQTLQKASGLLRSVVAMEIQRKRTPHLTFRVVPQT